MTRKPLIVGNWKMNKDHLESLTYLQKLYWILQDKNFDFTKVDLCILPPFTSIRSIQLLADTDNIPILYGAQDVADSLDGPYTGDISASFLKKLGCAFTLVGHSERRRYHDETVKTIIGKLRMSLEQSITPILCVGSVNADDDSAIDQQIDYALMQVSKALSQLENYSLNNLVIAYEPVSAIGTGQTIELSDIDIMTTSIRNCVEYQGNKKSADSVRILYGGSVDATNAQLILQLDSIDGLLVGGASLDYNEFARIGLLAAKGVVYDN
ncbi:MAG: triose-phosphate isomerase [Bifidobacteriaceae bacterium]|jgi:triosephosphate isomerase|nr:triose-phosphate isomerase [Bifidobacteriaceae bacterium]